MVDLETGMDETELRDALEQANIPTLLPTLAVLTGDSRWLREPYLPSRTKALDDNDSGGLSPERQAEVRAAAADAIVAWRDQGRPEPQLSPEELIDLLSVSLGEPVPDEYGIPMAEDAGLREREGIGWTNGRPAAAAETHTLVIGAGIAGIAAAQRLDRLGLPFTVVERSPSVGGVWWQNTYPGAGVDTPVHMYSFSFSPSADWSRFYAKQPEVLDYLERTASDVGIAEHLRLGTTVERLTWDEHHSRWNATLRGPSGDTETLAARFVISCVGQLNEPSIPAFTGMADFRGPIFHSAEWNHDVDLRDRRVAVIGTGATCMQIVPAIADTTSRVTVFQRSPQWIAPNGNYLRDVPEGVRALMREVPLYAAIYRLRLTWQFQDKLLPSLRKDPNWPHPERSVNATNEKHRVFFTEYLMRELEGRPDLIEKCLPDYPPYGKRILMDNEWYATLRRDDVELVTEGVSGFDEHHVITADGERHPADVVVLATGFQARKMLQTVEIVGRDGRSLRDQWGDDDASAYLGTSVPGFPNLFVVGGPHTGVGHGGSAIYTVECALTHITQALVHTVEHGARSIEVRRDVCDEHNARLDAAHEQLIWTHPGMSNWYRNRAGRVVLTMPWRGWDYWNMTRRIDLDEYVVR